jgi:hypothetical protein
VRHGGKRLLVRLVPAALLPCFLDNADSLAMATTEPSWAQFASAALARLPATPASAAHTVAVAGAAVLGIAAVAATYTAVSGGPKSEVAKRCKLPPLVPFAEGKTSHTAEYYQDVEGFLSHTREQYGDTYRLFVSCALSFDAVKTTAEILTPFLDQKKR